jgi:hypothetical protein
MKQGTAALIGISFAAMCIAPLEAMAHGLYEVTILVTDESHPPAVKDPNLVNPWGIAFNPNAFV